MMYKKNSVLCSFAVERCCDLCQVLKFHTVSHACCRSHSQCNQNELGHAHVYLVSNYLAWREVGY